MKKYIQHIIEPKKLLLVWQAPEGSDRTRFVVAKLIDDGEDIVFKYLVNTKDFNEARELGFNGYTAFKKFDITYNSNVVDAFMRRLPPRKRKDFPKYLEQLCIENSVNISDFALLGYSGAKLPTDGFSLVHPFYDISGGCEFLLEVAGFRYVSKIPLDEIHVGDKVGFIYEPDNKHDSDAVKIILNKEAIGYVNKALLQSFHNWIDNNYVVEGEVNKINGHPTRPLVYVFVTVKTEPQELMA